jgi:divalent metal cation (Fe/Co/Zn/Cd) transporter
MMTGYGGKGMKEIDEKKIVKKLSFVGILGNVLLAAFKLVAGLL